jgi:PKD repeat protein
MQLGSYPMTFIVADAKKETVCNASVWVVGPPSQVPVIPAIPGSLGFPNDADDDGKYEDINGNGRKDFADVVLYFNQMTWIAANEPVPAFDYNGNGRIDFADVVWLFNNL